MGTDEKRRLEKIYKESKLKPPYSKQSFVRRFWIFQNERIPLIVMAAIALSVTAAVARANNHFQWFQVTIATLMIILYFLQIRLADEPKDFEHDNKYYPDRPVQRGVITLKELSHLKNGVIASFLVLAALSGSWLVFGLACFQQAYSYLTRKEFFIREWLRKHFLTYQFSHYVQLFILAWLILTVLNIQPLHDKFIYFAYVMLMIGMIESSRTIGGTDKSEAQDRYSYRLGIGVSLASFAAFTLAVLGLTVFLIYRMQSDFIWLFLLIIGILVVGWTIIRYEHKPITKNAEFLNGASLVMFLCSAMAILLSK
jgi:hypothetical protein